MNKFELHPQLKSDCFHLGRFNLCELLMMNDGQYPWFILVPARHGIKETFELPQEDQIQLSLEINFLSQLLHSNYSADKINIAALGNMVPQLHVHVIARFHSDLSWPKPIWGNLSPKKFSKDKLLNTIDTLLPLLNKNINESNSQTFIWDDQWL